MKSSPFASIELAPRDPIIGVTETFKADTRAGKTNLGVGVYTDELGKVPLLDSVRTAEALVVGRQMPKGYQPIEGLNGYLEQVQTLLLGADSPLIAAGRVATFETLGGTGALKIGADFLRRAAPNAKVLISRPSWENHRAVFEFAHFEVQEYDYYNAETHGLDLQGMLKSLSNAQAGDIAVLHVCCHNPTGVDLSEAEWAQVAKVCDERALIPFLDMAYQGFSQGIDQDAVALRVFVDAGLNLLVANSFSKSFSLYGERVGALSIVTASADEKARVVSRVKQVIRTNYSNPPTHGGSIVATILASADLRSQWESELAHMRSRIKSMREGLVSRLNAKMQEHGIDRDFSFITEQRGMFSYSGLSTAQVHHMREHAGIYAIDSGRICLAAVNDDNIDNVASAMADAIMKA